MGSTKGSTGHQAKHAWSMAQSEYWRNAWKIGHDPFMQAGLKQAKGQAMMPWLQMGKTMGMQQADIQTRSLQDALAARGGGNLATALSMGSQARVGAGLQGLQAGAGMKQQALGTLLGGAQARLGLMNQLYGALQGVSSAQIGAGATMAAGQSQAMGNLLAQLMGGGGGSGMTSNLIPSFML